MIPGTGILQMIGRWIVLAAHIVFLCGTHAAKSDEPLDHDIDSPNVMQRIEEANAAYRVALETTDTDQRNQRFRRTYALFSDVIAALKDRAGAGLYVNAGNAALQSDQLGGAIHAYRRALQQEPHHVQARTNLQLARQLVPSWAQWRPEENNWRAMFFWHDMLAPDQIALVASVAFLLATIFVAFRIWSGVAWAGQLAVLPLVVWGIILIGQYVRGTNTVLAVVMTDTMARTADSHAAAPQFTDLVPAGAEGAVLQQREGWTRVQIAGQGTWLPSTSLKYDDTPSR